MEKKQKNQEIQEIQEIQNLKKYDEAYHYKGTPLISDEDYDQYKEKVYTLYPNHPYFKEIGAPLPPHQKKVTLPYYMGSMDKIKDISRSLPNFKKHYGNPPEYVISDKLDGISALLYSHRQNNRLFTRGNGYQGQDVSSVLPVLKNAHHIQKFLYLCSNIKNIDKIAIRGEFIISKTDFHNIQHLGANPRNMVAGIMNSKNPATSPIISYVQFVPYTVIEPPKNPTEQFMWLYEKGWEPVFHKIVKKEDINASFLYDMLKKRKTESPYDIDGLIIAHNSYYPLQHGTNPKNAFAFKFSSYSQKNKDNTENENEDEEKKRVKVKNVEWNITKDGLLKPVVTFEPISLNGVIIKRATGFNAHFIDKHKIGPGTEIIIIRSGDVIPYIQNVVKSTSPQMPENIDYIWNENHIDIKIKDTENKDMAIKQLEHFFQNVKIPGFSTSNIKKMYEFGFRDPISILYADKDTFQKVIGNANGKKIHESMEYQRDHLSCVELMAATNLFGPGLGTKKIKMILEALPYPLIKENKLPSVQELISIEGISEITAEQFIEGWKKFSEFMQKHPYVKCQENQESQKKQEKDKKMTGEIIVFTGFRDKDLEQKTENLGGKVVNSMSKKVTILVYKTYNEDSQKIKQALSFGNVKLYSVEDYKKMLT